jgi:hypothetical protein
MTKEEVLQKVNDYCNERSYTSETLTDGFKDKFADHFVRQNPDGDINDEATLNQMKFAINTAFSSASDIITVKNNAFTSKENGYKNQIAELNKKLGNPQQQQQQQNFQIPTELQEQLDELKRFKNEESRKSKFNEIIALAKKNVREDCLADFDIFVKDYEVKDDVSAEEQAKKLHSRFQEIFKSRIGDITPLAPRQTQKEEKEMLESVTKIEL